MPKSTAVVHFPMMLSIIISFTAKGNKDDQKKHNDFVKRMENKGYTDRQVRRLVEWYMRVQKSS